MSLNRNDILKANNGRYTTVYVDSWGGDVRLKAMSVADQIEYEKVKDASYDVVMCTLLVMCCVDDEGERLFTADDITCLQSKNSADVLLVFRAAADLNLVTNDKIEKIAKN